ncbi:hypothetical protein ACFQ1I_31705 [Kitasatospora arboriphila]
MPVVAEPDGEGEPLGAPADGAPPEDAAAEGRPEAAAGALPVWVLRVGAVGAVCTVSATGVVFPVPWPSWLGSGGLAPTFDMPGRRPTPCCSFSSQVVAMLMPTTVDIATAAPEKRMVGSRNLPPIGLVAVPSVPDGRADRPGVLAERHRLPSSPPDAVAPGLATGPGPQ